MSASDNEFDRILEVIEKIAKGQESLASAYSLLWEKTVYIQAGKCFELIGRLAPLNGLDPLGKAWNIFSRGQCCVFAARYAEATGYASEALAMFEVAGETGGCMAAHLMLCMCFRSIGQLDKAQDHIQCAVDLAEKIGNQTIYEYLRGVVYYQASEMELLLKRYHRAIGYLTTGIEVASANPEIEGRMYLGMGNAHLALSDWNKAEEYFLQAKDLLKNQLNPTFESKVYSDLGVLYHKKDDLELSRSYHEKSLELRIANGLSNPAITSYIHLAQLYSQVGNFEQAIEYANAALEQAEKTNVLIRIYEAHFALSNIYELKGDTRKAFDHFKKYHAAREKLFDQEVINKIEQLNTQHKVETVAKEKEIFRLRNVELKSALDEITESVRYARFIQSAILPPVQDIRQHLRECFVLYKPKDILAGDFYWMDVADGRTYFATCDCTGHGIPGAMVSVVCHNALNRAVRELGLREPAEILDNVRQMVIAQFAKSDDQVKDGMDCVLFSIDEKRMKLHYAAANNSFCIVRKDELICCEADKMPVGSFVRKADFTGRSVAVQKGDMIYTFTDGYADQFGGPRKKKFGYRRFEELLGKASALPCDEQHKLLSGTLDAWMVNEEQVDDVLVVGIRVS